MVFASDAGGQSPGKVARVVSPGPGLEPRLIAEARGAADATALRLKHHDPKLHASRTGGSDSDARAVFDALERARVESLGARSMDGVRANLNDLAEARVRLDAITRARSGEEVPLATAVGLLARQRLTGEPPPWAARAGLELIAPWIEEKAGAELDALALTIDDQASFATLSRRLLEDLELVVDEPSDQEPEEGGEEGRETRKAPTRTTKLKLRMPMAAAKWKCARKRPSVTRARTKAPTARRIPTKGKPPAHRKGRDRPGPMRSAGTGPKSRSPIIGLSRPGRRDGRGTRALRRR